MKFLVATALIFVSSATLALSDETTAKTSAPDVNVCAVTADPLIGCKPYKSGRDERHKKIEPTLPDNSIANENIVPLELGVVGQNADVCILQENAPIKDSKLFWLKRPGESNCVAVLEESPDENRLNPVNRFNYGRIPLLEHLTISQANELWGKPSCTTGTSESTFELISQNQTKFFIDTKFANDKLVEYRVRTDREKNPVWKSLNKKPTMPDGSPKPDND